jgi:prepilin-type N-terminal cleavage/methylation domain-containing protein
MKASKLDAFTLIELLVVISIIAILAGIALPVFGSVQVKGAQTKALSNAKQIGTALRLYAVDNNGTYPSYVLGANGKPATPNPQLVGSSNVAFAQLIPDYMPNEEIFWLTKSKWCNPNPPDNQVDQAGTYTPVLTLAAGENEWAYAPGLNDTSNPSWPLIADGFTTGSEADPVYAAAETVKGGVWKGKNAIVIRCDTSGSVMKVSQAGFKVLGPVNAAGGAEDNIFKSVPATWIPNPIVNPL